MKPTYVIQWYRSRSDGAPDEVASQDGYGPLNLLGHAEMIHLAIPQSCGGQAECGTCRIRLLEGTATQHSYDERDLMVRHASRFRDGERLACRARPRSDLKVQLLAEMPSDLRDVPDDVTA